MKPLIMLCCLMPLFGLCQKLKINEFDKFTRQRRVEVEPVLLLSAGKANVSMSLAAAGSSLYFWLNGTGWGASTIDAGNEVIFLFSNDSTLAIKSTGLQTCEFTAAGSSYKHKYFISADDLKLLTQYNLVGIRKYGFKDFNDLHVSKTQAEKIKKLSVLFVEELRKAKVIQGLKKIELKDITRHVGDSVQFCSKVYSTRNFESAEGNLTLLDVNPSYGMQPVAVVIRGADREKFLDKPEQLYKDKEVCITGMVQMYNNIPQIVLYHRQQIKVKSPVDIADISFFTGDTVTVSGRVFSAKYLEGSATSPTLLNMGAAYPDQLLTVVIEGKDRANFMQQPESFFTGKEISVTGKVALYKGKPQIVVQRKDQIRVTNDNAIQYATLQESSVRAGGDSRVEESKGINRQATFPGGDEAWIKLMKKNLKCPDELPVGGEKIVVARFHVSAMGYITNISIVSSGGEAFDKEVLRALKLMPAWQPQLVNGKPVASAVTRTISFVQIGEKDLKPF